MHKSFVNRATALRSAGTDQRSVLGRLLAMARTACGLTLDDVAAGAKVSA